VPWYQSELLMKQIGAISSLLGVGTVVVGVVAFLLDLWTPVSLKIAAPAVIELRCSSLSFNSDLCNRASAIADAHVSVSGAFRIEAVGPARNSASIDKATVELSIGKTKVELDAFWSQNLVPGGEGSRRQVVPTSIAGGQAQSQEFWFMPLPKLCPASATSCRERENFRSWLQFLNADLALTTEQAEAKTPRIGSANFCFTWSRSGKYANRSCLPCKFDLGPTVYHAMNRQDPIYATVRCH